MKQRLIICLLPVAAICIGVVIGAVLGPAIPGDSGPGDGLDRAQAGGLGVILPPPDGTGPPAAPAAVAGPSSAPIGRYHQSIRSSRQAAEEVIYQKRAQQAAPFVEGLQQNPDLLLRMMDLVRNDPELRRQAVERMRQSGGLAGAAGQVMNEEMLGAILNGLMADPQRLQGILGAVSQNPQLLQGMLASMGMGNITQGEMDAVMGQLNQNPDMLAPLAHGDQSAVEQLANGVAGAQGGQGGLATGGDIGNALAALAQMQQAGQMGQGVPGGMISGMGDLGGTNAPMGGADLQSLLGSMGAGGPQFGSDFLGAGASLSVLADMLGVFGGGAQTGELQDALRSGDIQGLLGMVNEIYGPNGTLSKDPALAGKTINSYTDLLNALLDMDQ